MNKRIKALYGRFRKGVLAGVGSGVAAAGTAASVGGSDYEAFLYGIAAAFLVGFGVGFSKANTPAA